MIEHILVAVFVIILLNIVRKAGIKSRGKSGIKEYITKFIVRLSRKIPFLRGKIDQQL